MQWCGGSLNSFVQLTREQLPAHNSLANTSAFYWFNRPTSQLWRGTELIGRELLGSQSPPEAESPSTTGLKLAEKRSEPGETYNGPSMLVDGSTHFLAITLPSREHPLYSEMRELLDQYRFKLEPRNRKWWLRDRHQTLNFLSAHREDLESRYNADFTDNFQSRTNDIKEIELKVKAEEETDGYLVSFSISRPGADEALLTSAWRPMGDMWTPERMCIC